METTRATVKSGRTGVAARVCKEKARPEEQRRSEKKKEKKPCGAGEVLQETAEEEARRRRHSTRHRRESSITRRGLVSIGGLLCSHSPGPPNAEDTKTVGAANGGVSCSAASLPAEYWHQSKEDESLRDALEWGAKVMRVGEG